MARYESLIDALGDTPLVGLPQREVHHAGHQGPGDHRGGQHQAVGDGVQGIRFGVQATEGGGHVHASKDEELPWLLKKLIGPMNHDVDTADEAWRFFRTKSRRRGTGGGRGVVSGARPI